MKTFIITITLALASLLASAQKSSSKIVTKTYDYKNFDKLTFIGFNEDITIQVGKEFSIVITLKENSEKNLDFDYNEKEHALSLKIKPSTEKENYKDRNTYKIKITMPEISVLSNTGNGDVSVTGIMGRYFRAEAKGNGNVVCKGTIDELDIEKLGNGDVVAKELKAQKAKVSSTGNGNVMVNVSDVIVAKNVGNGDVTNNGKAKFSSDSKSVGNGKLINN